MLTQRINESTQNNYSSRGVPNMRLNLNSVNPYFHYETNSKNIRDEKLGQGRSNNSSNNNIQSLSMNDIQLMKVNSKQSNGSNSNVDLQQYKKSGSTCITDRLNYNQTGSNNPYSITNFSSTDQRRSDVTYQTPTIACFNCSSNLQINELQLHHSERCIRENPQIDGLDSSIAMQQIDSKFERINAYFSALLKEQKLLGIKERKSLILKEITQRALHCNNQTIFQSILNELTSEFPTTNGIPPDYLSCHANQIKNIIILKLQVIPQLQRSISPLKQQEQNTSLKSNNFFISNNYNQPNSSNLRIQTEHTPRTHQDLSEAGNYYPSGERSYSGFHSPQVNIQQKNNLFKLFNNSANKGTNLFNNYLTNQQNNGSINENKPFNYTAANNRTNSSNISGNLDANLNGSYYQVTQQNTNQSMTSPTNNFSTTHQNFKHVPTFQINLNQPSSNNQTNNNSYNNLQTNNTVKSYLSHNSNSNNNYYNNNINNTNTNSNNNNNINNNNNKEHNSLLEYYIQNPTIPLNNSTSINKPTTNPISNINQNIGSPQRFTFASNLEQSVHKPIFQSDTSSTSPYLLNNIPSFSASLSNNFSSTISTNDKTNGQQVFFPPTLQTVNSNLSQSQFKSVSPTLSLGQSPQFNFQDSKSPNKLFTEGVQRASSPQSNFIAPKPCFSSPQQPTFSKDFTQKNILQSNIAPTSRTFKSQRVLNFDIKDLNKLPIQPKIETEESVKKSNNIQNVSQLTASFQPSSSETLNSQVSSISKNELLSKLIQKQKDLINLQQLSSQLKQTYETHQDEINKVYNISNVNSSRSPVPQGRLMTSNDSSLSYITQENIYSHLLKQQASSHNNSTEITQTSLLSPNQLSSMTEILTEEDKNLQTIFYNLCLKEKMNLPKYHMAQKLPISLLFKEALDMNVRDEEQMKYFIQYAFENATTYIDIDKLKKSNKNQIFKNNLANKVFLQQPI